MFLFSTLYLFESSRLSKMQLGKQSIWSMNHPMLFEGTRSLWSRFSHAFRSVTEIGEYRRFKVLVRTSIYNGSHAQVPNEFRQQRNKLRPSITAANSPIHRHRFLRLTRPNPSARNNNHTTHDMRRATQVKVCECDTFVSRINFM